MIGVDHGGQRSRDGYHLEDLDKSNPLPSLISTNGVGFFRKCKKTDLKMAADRKFSGDDRGGHGLGFVPLGMRNAMLQLVVGFHRNLTWKFTEVKF